MSYSRWGYSDWYTFWCCTESNKRDDQIFDVCTIRAFTYKELKEDITKCLSDVKDHVVNSGEFNEDYINKCTTIKSMNELKGYMEMFIEDVEEDYKKGELEV